MFKNFLSLSNLTLLTALSLSTVAAYYSIYGLTAIFAGAVIPIIVMGSILEVGKICTTVWLRKYWDRCGWVLKSYLVPAVVLLAFLTSMGIFGFLSKAHSDQNLVSGDVQSKLAIIDEKIKTARENIEADRKQLKQMDDAVDQVMGRSTSEEGATKANNIRKSQQRERGALAKDIEAQQKIIIQLNEEAAPIRAENRKVEAEVGPIKYIAAFIYGDNPDSNLLERAVRWVIILIVIVFDPLAIALVLAANASKDWDKEVPKQEDTPDPYVPEVGEKPTQEELKEIDEFVEQAATETLQEIVEEEKNIDPSPAGWMYTNVVLDEKPKETKKKKPRKKKEPKVEAEPEPVMEAPAAIPDVERPGDYLINTQPEDMVHHSVGDYVTYKGKHMHINVLKNRHPELFAQADKLIENGFGATFPLISRSGNLFVRTDVIPNKLFKFNGSKWIEVNKEKTNSYLDNDEYLKFLVEKIASGEYDLYSLTENEQDAIQNYMKKTS